jgi:anti-sigma B factor antagonist
MSMLEISIADRDSCPLITLSGQADQTTGAQLSELVTDQLSRGMTRLMVDAAGLSFADWSAIRTLVVAALTLKDRGGGMILLHPQRRVARMLSLIGADRVIAVDLGSGVSHAPEDSAEAAI